MIEEISAFQKMWWQFKLHDQMEKINEYNELIKSAKQKKGKLICILMVLKVISKKM